MQYTKPHILTTTDAVSNIMSNQPKNPSTMIDSEEHLQGSFVAGYDGDE